MGGRPHARHLKNFVSGETIVVCEKWFLQCCFQIGESTSCGIGGNNFALRLLLPLLKLILEDAFRPSFALPVGGGPIQFPFFSGKKEL